MAWCEQCDCEVKDEEVRHIGEARVCPHCKAPLAPEPNAPDLNEEDDEEEGPPKAPWHFKLLLVGTIGYLIYRLIWFIDWLPHH